MRATWRGALLRCVVIAAEVAGFLYFGSSALLVDAIASTLDIGATLLLALCVQLAGRPPDENHPFGHGRFEPLAGLQLGVVLAAVGGFVLVQQLFLTVSHQAEGMDPRAWMIPFAGVLLLEYSYQQTSRSAKKANSPALLAEAWHYRIDALSSLLATIALVAAALFPRMGGVIDHLGALAIAILMIAIGARAAWMNLHQLLDRIPDDSFFALVKQAATRVEGVLGTEKIRIQLYGPDAHVDIDVEVDPKLTVDSAHRISQNVRAEIQREWSAVRDVTVHIEPYYPGDH